MNEGWDELSKQIEEQKIERGRQESERDEQKIAAQIEALQLLLEVPVEIEVITAEELLELGIQLRDAVDMLSLGLAQLIPVFEDAITRFKRIESPGFDDFEDEDEDG